MVSVTSRNHFLWKIDQGKAKRILSDTLVIKAIQEWKLKDENNIIFEEGFSCKEDIAAAKNHGVDAVILGEELLAGCTNDVAFDSAVERWVLG
jgi:indole-3-glycerol phosphate synthase